MLCLFLQEKVNQNEVETCAAVMFCREQLEKRSSAEAEGHEAELARQLWGQPTALHGAAPSLQHGPLLPRPSLGTATRASLWL